MTDNKQQDNRQQDNQRRDKGRDKGGGRQNPLSYNFGVAKRYLGTMLQEAFLSALFVAPFYAIFYFAGITEVTLQINFVTLWAIALFIFILQNSLFRRGG